MTTISTTRPAASDGPRSTSPIGAAWIPPSGPQGRSLLVDAGTLPSTPGPLDHELVALIRQEVSDQLALRLRATPVADPRARRELARAILTESLVARSRGRVHAGQPPLSVDDEFALADAVTRSGLGAPP